MGGFTTAACRRADAWLAAIDYSIAQAWASFTFAGRFLRRAVKVDRNRYLESLVQDVRVSDLARPKTALPTNVSVKAFPKAQAARRSSYIALPAVKLADGVLAASAEQRAQRWRDHFADQESGVAVSAAEYTSRLVAVDARRAATPQVRFDPSLLPDLLSLEEDILGLRRPRRYYR